MDEPQLPDPRASLDSTDADDPVIEHLRGAETGYRELQAAWTRRGAELQAVREALVAAEREQDRLAVQAEIAQARLEQERAAAEQQRRRAEGLAAAVKDIHRAVFGGNVYDLLLRTCLSLTGGMRGLYVAAPVGDRSGDRRVRAAVDMDGYPRKPLCRRRPSRPSSSTVVW